MKADLHLHTYYSDGTLAPAEVAARAGELGFDWIAITDHDTVGGVSEAMQAARKRKIGVIPAVEITSQFQNHELHLLAYFSPEDRDGEGWRHDDLLDHLRHDARNRLDRVERILQRLNALDLPLTMEEVLQQAARGRARTQDELLGTLGRPHIAAALLAAGRVASLDQAFSEYLKKGRPAWVDKERSEARKVLALVHRLGGVASLAHPGLSRNGNIPDHLRAEGIDAVEVYHSRHSQAQSARFRSWAHENRLLITGGSDCHGMLKGEPLMGRVELRDEDLDLFLDRLRKPSLR